MQSVSSPRRLIKLCGKAARKGKAEIGLCSGVCVCARVFVLMHKNMTRWGICVHLFTEQETLEINSSRSLRG